MAMSCKKIEIGFKPVTVSGTRIFVSSKMQENVTLLVEGIKNHQQLGEYGFFGTMFHGMPGTGKSLHAEHIAELTGASLFKAPLLTDPGDVAELYSTARTNAKNKPVIVLLNDLDYLGKRSEGSMNQAFRPVLAQILTEMEQRDNKGVFTFITTNLPDNIDEALRRPPRVTFELEFLPPTRGEREKMLEAILSNSPMKIVWTKEMVSLAADLTFGYVPGDLFGIVQNASMQAIVRTANEVTKEDILKAKAMQKPSAIRDMPFIEPTERLEDFAGGYIFSQKAMLAELGARIDNGVNIILYGPSGCGKTGLAKGIIGTFKYNGIYINAADVIDKWLGESGKKFARAVDRAKALAPAVLVIDQAEGIISQNQYSDDWVSVLKSKLSEPIPGVMVVMTTTNPSNWGAEILGRFHKIYVGAPYPNCLIKIAEKALPQGHNVNIPAMFERVEHVTPRELKNAIKRILDFGGELTTELLIAVLGTYPTGARDNGYDQIKQFVGDETAIFREIKSASYKPKTSEEPGA